MGFIFSIIAGAAMSIQGVMNTRLGDKIGLYEANAFVQGTAFLLSLIAVWLVGKGDFRLIGQSNKLYLFGGVLGLATYFVRPDVLPSPTWYGAIITGLASGLSAVGINQIPKQLGKDK